MLPQEGIAVGRKQQLLAPIGKTGKRDAGRKPKVGPGNLAEQLAFAISMQELLLSSSVLRLRLSTWMAVFSPFEEREHCPICFLPFSHNINQTEYYSCCGKTICIGCSYHYSMKRRVGRRACPFCRSTAPEDVAVLQRRVESGGGVSAMATIVNRHMSQRQIDDAVKLCVRAAESGNLNSIAMLGLMFFQNQGEEWPKSVPLL